MSTEDMIKIYEERAEKIRNNDNRKIFLQQQRKELLSDAEGKILEVAVGRGNNFRFYPATVKVIAVDFSPTLLQLAKEMAIENNI